MSIEPWSTQSSVCQNVQNEILKSLEFDALRSVLKEVDAGIAVWVLLNLASFLPG